MSAPRTIPDTVTAVQHETADPRVSAFVSANAGSGKTHVLVSRVIRLLLDGVDPAKILCITFTKAAAANMADRVFGRLSSWIALDDLALDGELRALGVASSSPGQRARARRLFAAALDAPGGLKVETIHAFCTRLLQRFPFEARVPAHFAVLDERQAAEMLERATLAVLLDAAAAPDTPLGRSLSAAIASAADQTVRELIGDMVGRRAALGEWIDAAGGIEGAVTQLSRALGLAPDDAVETIEKEIVEGPILPASEWRSLAALLRTGTPNDRTQAERFDRAYAASGAERIAAYRSVFLTAEGCERTRLVTKAIADAHPALAARLVDECARVRPLFTARAAACCRDRTVALMRLAHEVITRHEAEKARRGLLDYDDLITRTLDLLGRTGAAWVHYKLDRAIDHVLVDEAQDTSPSQWEIVRRLVAEFTAGDGARTAWRSVFAVGDEKQSIFSFQGAAPKEFAEMRRWFEREHRHAGLPFVAREFKHSFRSGANVLGAVDAVFGSPDMFASVTSDGDAVPPHLALPDAAPGLVEVWPLEPADAVPEIEGWDAPFDTLVETSPQVKLATRVARDIRDALATGVSCGIEDRPLAARDVLVLVRQRGPVFEAIIRALKEAGVPVAGADRLRLTAHVAVGDLMVLADALLCPADDLALATVLKSPLVGFDDALLFELAHARGGTLAAALRDKAAERAEFAAAAAFVARCAARVLDGPFAFYAWLLGPEGGRARILARLGLEANDALDEFLSLALEHERVEPPSLQGFVAWLRAADSEIKRDMEIGRDEVRVMTVHGAKGLEAPWVYLADTTQPPSGHHPPRLLRVALPDAPPGLTAIVWAGRKDDDPAALATARALAASEACDEYRRLLYVAMTRAAHRLVVCGFAHRTRKPPEGCWHDLVVRNLAGRPGATEDTRDGFDAPVIVYRKVEDVARASLADTRVTAPEPAEPPWLRRSVPTSAAAATPLSPSRALAGGTVERAQDGSARRTARQRGVAAHRLLQVLPDVAPARRREVASAYLAGFADLLDAESRERLIAQTLAVIEDDRLAELFAPGSRAEVPIVGRIARPDAPPLVVSGQIDRLAVAPDAVTIADYKTNRPAPTRLADVPAAYVAQLALYRAVLSSLYADRPVRACLVFTDTLTAFDVPAHALDAAMHRLLAAP